MSADFELALRMADKQKIIDYVPGNNNFKILRDLNESQTAALNTAATCAQSILCRMRRTGRYPPDA